MTRISVTVDGASVLRRRRAPDAARAVPARDARQDRHRRSAATPATAAPAPSTSTARSVKSCNVLAVQADGARGRPRSRASPRTASCTRCRRPSTSATPSSAASARPGMIMQSVDLLNDNPNPTEEEIRVGLEGNLCRCTGYHNIVKAVQHAAGRAASRAEEAASVTATDERRRAASPRSARTARRKEDQRLITGRTRWTDNIQLPGMLHLAMVRSPFAHAKITSIDTAAAKAAPNVVAVLTGADLERRRRASASTPGRSPPTRRRPTHLPIAVDRVAFAGEIVAVVVGPHRRRGPRRRRARRRRLRRAAGRARPQGGRRRTRCSPTPTSAPTSRAFWQLDSAEAGHRRQRRRGHRQGPRRRHRHRARVPPAAADPGVHGAALGRRRPDRRADHHVVGHPDPAHPAVPARRHDRRPRVQDPGHRARRRRRLRRQAPDDARGVRSPSRWPAGSASRCKYTETRSRVADVGPPRPRPVAEADPRRRRRTARSPASRSTCSPTSAPTSALVGGGVPVLGAFMFNAIYKFPAYQFNCQTVLTNKTWTDAYRGAGRPEATFAIERMMDELAAEVGVDPLEIREKNWIKHEEFPFTTVAGHDLRLRQLRGRHGQGQGALRLRRAAGRAEAAPRVATTRSSSASASRRSPRCAAWRPRGCSAASTTAPAAGSTPSIRMLATGKVEVVTGVVRRTARATRRRGQPDRRRPARRAVRGRRGAARRHPDRATRAWTPTARARSSSVARRWSGPPTR